MATGNESYDSPDYTINRDHCAGEVGGAATTAYGKFHAFAATRLKAVHFRVTVAGTNTGHGFDVYIGTTSVATQNLSTNTAGYTATLAIGSNVNSLQAVEVRSLADATGRVVVAYEYAYQVGANMTQ